MKLVPTRQRRAFTYHNILPSFTLFFTQILKESLLAHTTAYKTKAKSHMFTYKHILFGVLKHFIYFKQGQKLKMKERIKGRCEKKRQHLCVQTSAALQTLRSLKSLMINTRHVSSLACETFYAPSLSLHTTSNYFS